MNGGNSIDELCVPCMRECMGYGRQATDLNKIHILELVRLENGWLGVGNVFPDAIKKRSTDDECAGGYRLVCFTMVPSEADNLCVPNLKI